MAHALHAAPQRAVFIKGCVYGRVMHFVLPSTILVHIKHIVEKLGASDCTQAIAIRRGIIHL